MTERGSRESLLASPAVLPLAVGATVGCLALAVLLIRTGRRVAAPSLLGSALAVGIAGAIAVELTPGFDGWLRRSGCHQLLVAVPLVGVALRFVPEWVTVVPRHVAIPFDAFLLFVVSVVLAVLVVVLSDIRRVSALRHHDDPTVEWEAGEPRKGSSQRFALPLIMFVVGGIGIWTGLLVDEFGSYVIGFLLSSVLTAAGDFDRERRAFEAYSEALVVDPVEWGHARPIPWSRVTGYTVTEGALVLSRGRLRRPIRCSKAEIDDLQRVTATLDLHLDRQRRG